MDSKDRSLWLESLKSYRQERVAEAVKQHMADPRVLNNFPLCKSFPMPGELIARLDETDKLTPPESLADPNCANCGGSGWRMVKMLQKKHPVAARCHCWGTGVVSPELAASTDIHELMERITKPIRAEAK